MTKEDKELLIQDLCARLPYGFIIYRPSDNANLKISDIDDFAHFLEYSDGEEFKPYLRPMSRMTEEEKKEYIGFKHVEHHEWDGHGTYTEYVEVEEINNYFDWLIAHYFDYRNLIDKGLAIESPEGMYNTKYLP